VLTSLCRVDCNDNTPQVIVLSPTYELALQTGQVEQQMAKYKPQIKLRFVVREENIPRDQRLTEHVIIGTPAKLMDSVLKYEVFDLKNIKVFVLDETDVMIDSTITAQKAIRFEKALPDSQMMLFFATYDFKVMEFTQIITRDPFIIKLKRKEESVHHFNQFSVVCRNEDQKYKALANTFGTISMGQVFVFCETQASVTSLANMLRKVRIIKYSFLYCFQLIV
jgi:ATP-dependent RNA helicase DDX19/DBP5